MRRVRGKGQEGYEEGVRAIGMSRKERREEEG
jgi:hypothetical protein